jgi:hypothetical protein
MLNVQQLVRDSGITGGNESKVGYYVGILVTTHHGSKKTMSLRIPQAFCILPS